MKLQKHPVVEELMKSRMMAGLALAVALCLGTGLRADPAKTEQDVAIQQEALARQYANFEQALIQLAMRLDRSSKADDKEKAARLKEAVRLASDKNLKNKFEKINTLLAGTKGIGLREITDAMQQQQMVAEDIRAILAILMDDGQLERRKKEIASKQEMLDKIKELIRQQKLVNLHTAKEQMDKEELAQLQKAVQKATAGLSKTMRGQDGKSALDPAANPSSNANNPNAPHKDGQDETPGARQVQDAAQKQENAANKIQNGDKPGAGDDQQASLQDLEEAKKKLEEILRQLREEEIERVIAALKARCEKMLALQTAVYEETRNLDGEIAKNSDKKPNRVQINKALTLADREHAIVGECVKAIQLLESEGSTVAFPVVFHQLRDDMIHVARRLSKADVGVVTQAIEQDIIINLGEMVEVLTKAQKDRENPPRPNPEPNPDDRNGQPKPRDLVEKVAELKMIRSLQGRVNDRTQMYGKRYQGEQPADVEIQQELKNLSERQKHIARIVEKIAAELNK
jgi:hypothetical protein